MTNSFAEKKPGYWEKAGFPCVENGRETCDPVLMGTTVHTAQRNGVQQRNHAGEGLGTVSEKVFALGTSTQVE